jgi:hypothetical protein
MRPAKSAAKPVAPRDYRERQGQWGREAGRDAVAYVVFTDEERDRIDEILNELDPTEHELTAGPFGRSRMMRSAPTSPPTSETLCEASW